MKRAVFLDGSFFGQSPVASVFALFSRFTPFMGFSSTTIEKPLESPNTHVIAVLWGYPNLFGRKMLSAVFARIHND